MNMRICKRLFLIGMALSLVLAGCGDPGTPKSTEAKITALTLAIGDVEEIIDFGTGKTATVVLPGSTTPNMPDSATVELVTLSEGASGLVKDQVLPIIEGSVTEGSVTVTITAEDGVTTGTYTVTVSIGEKLDLNTVGLSYTDVPATEGTANDTGVEPAWDVGDTGGPPPTGIIYSLSYTGSGTDGSGDTVVIDPGTGKITITDVAIAANSGPYTVTATAGGSSNYLKDSTQTAEVTVGIAKRNLSTIALSYPVSTIKAFASISNDIGIEPAWTTSGSPPPEGIAYSIIASTANGPTTDGSGNTVVIVESTGKITITAGAVVANSGTYTVTATAGESSNYLNDAPQTVDVTVEITDTKVDLSTAEFVYVDVVATAGTANTTGVTPVWDANSVPPSGVAYTLTAYTATAGSGTNGSGGTVLIDENTGVITITDVAIAENSGEYTVTATAGTTSNYADTTTQTAPITVRIINNVATITELTLVIDSVEYPITFETDKTAKIVLPAGSSMPDTATVKAVTLSIGASGLAQDASVSIDANGEASIIITAEDGVTTGDYTVKVQESLDGYSLSYPMAKRSADGSISVSPIWKKGAVDEAPDDGGVSYAIAPALPTGLALDTNSGTISGTMPSLDKVSAYQITATGNGTDYVNTATGTFLDKFVSEETYTPVTTGTAISNIAELQAITQALGGEYYLTAHIDLSAETSWAPFPFMGGTLHGNGYAIYNLTIAAPDVAYQGLFSSVSGATVENLGIGVTSIKGQAAVGALAGYAETATLSNIAVAPMVADAKIEAVGSVDIADDIGTSSYIGGAVGFLKDSSLTGYSLVSVQSLAVDGHVVGGFVGYSAGSTTIGYATGDVTGTGSIGGLVGQSHVSINKGYATGDVSGSDKVGGFIGTVSGNISTKSSVGYATGVVSGTTDVGGFIGNVNLDYRGTITGYWDKQSTGQDTSAGGANAVGISKTQSIVFASANSYTDSGNSNSPIFEITAFTDIFDTTNGAGKTWPKLKSDSFALIQPTVSDIDDDGTIEVVY